MAIPMLSDPLNLALVKTAFAGLAGAAVDFGYASLGAMLQRRRFAHTWQAVASGWIGPASFKGGKATVALGLATHVLIALAMASAYALAAVFYSPLLDRPMAYGAIYGLVLYGVMYGIVLPLRWPSAYPRWERWRSIGDIIIHVMVGLTIAGVLSN